MLQLLLLCLVCQVRLQAANPAGSARAASHADLEPLYRDNLEQDFKAYASAAFSVADLLRMVQGFGRGRPPKHLTLLVVRGNAVRPVPLTKTQPPLTAKRVQAIVEGLNNATRHDGLQLQDTILLLNTWDEPRCAEGSVVSCTAPVFSLIKQWDWASSTPRQRDILVPFFSHSYGDIIDTPWESKTPKALMRAAAQNGMDRNCTRLWLLELAKTPLGQKLLDVGITNNLKKGLKVELANYVDIPSHAQWKYLLSTDGFTASCRFGKLLQINSAVLKEESQWIEYYYRSVKPGTHFFPFNKNNVLQVLQDLEAGPDAKLKQVAAAAQQFGYRYLSLSCKALYFARAIEMYNAMFTNGAQFVGTLDVQTQLSLEQLVVAMQAYT